MNKKVTITGISNRISLILVKLPEDVELEKSESKELVSVDRFEAST